MPGRKPLYEKKKLRWTIMVEPELKEGINILSEKMKCSASNIVNEAFHDIVDKYCDKGVYSLRAKNNVEERAEMLQKDGRDHKGISILFANHKGGVAKTTTTASLAVIAGFENKRVLVVDLDGQMNVSGLFGYDKEWDGKGVGYYFNDCINRIKRNKIDFDSLENYVQPTNFKNVDIMVGSLDTDHLSHAFAETGSILGSKTIVGLMLKSIRNLNIYDYILFDASPSNNNIINDAIRSCDWTITPSNPAHDSMEGANEVINFIKTQEEFENKVSKHAGILFTRVDSRTMVGKSLAEFKNSFEDGNVHTFKTFIPISSAVEKSEFMRAPVSSQYPADKVTKKYKEFYRELVSLIG